MSLKIKVVDPNKILYEGEAKMVTAPGVLGTLGILPGHTPMFAELTEGDFYIQGDHEEVITISSGIVKVKNDELLTIVGL